MLALIWLAPRQDRAKPSPALKSFGVLPDRKEEAATTQKTVKKAESKTAAKERQPAPPKAVTPPKEVPVPPKAPTLAPPTILPLDLASSDIGKIKGRAADSGEGDSKGDTKDSASTYGPGEGPGGQRLYDAEWYPHRPSNAELNGYLPGGAPPGGWALIACHTIPDYHVDNCQSLGESPIGSGLARAMRQAAWQFRVRPPRIGGKTLVGAWVRIRIDFTRVGAGEGSSE